MKKAIDLTKEELRKYLKESGLDYTTFAYHMGCSTVTIYNYITGRRAIPCWFEVMFKQYKLKNKKADLVKFMG